MQPRNGDYIETHIGDGYVRRVSEAQKSVQVEIKGQLYEVPFENIKSIRGRREPGKMDPDWRVKMWEQIQQVHGVQPRHEWEQDGTWDIEALDKLINKGEKKKKMPAKKKPVDFLSQYLESVDDKVTKQISKSIEVGMGDQLKEIKDAVKKNQKLEVVIDGKSHVVAGLRHEQLEELIMIAQLRLPALMVGMAGTGKTHAAEQVAEALGIKFYAMSVGAQTSKSDIIGYMNANGDYVNTHFRQAYEKGGVFLMDEVDAGNSNVLIQINSALSNGQASFPDKMVKMHKDFIFIATANTFGTGMDRQYVGRNQLDAATLDRFTVIEWDIDDALEESLATGKHGAKWYKTVRACRDFVAEHGIRALVTPRATVKGSKLLHAGMKVEDVIKATILNSVPDDRKEEVTKVALKVFGNSSVTDGVFSVDI